MSTDVRSHRPTWRLPPNLSAELLSLCAANDDTASCLKAVLDRLMSACGAAGGGVWSLKSQGVLSKLIDVGLPAEITGGDASASQQHARSLVNVLTTSQPTIIPPQAGDGDAGNATDFTLAAAAAIVSTEQAYVLEIFLETGQGATTPQAIRAVVQAGAIVAARLQEIARRDEADESKRHQRVDLFTRTVHGSLNRELAAFHIANEARELLDCDRVSVAIRRGSRCRMMAVSGQDSIEPRADVSKTLNRIAQRVAAIGEAVWFDGVADNLAPQIEEVLNDHLENAQVKSVAVLPLIRPPAEKHEFIQTRDEDEEREPPGELVGVLILEQLRGVLPRQTLEPFLEPVLLHSAVALGNARDHSDLFLMPLWRLLGKAANLFKGGLLPVTVAVLLVLVAGTIALFTVPADFTLEAPGMIQPTQQRDIFASVAGVVQQLHVNTGDQVSVRSPLIDLRNPDLDLQQQQLLGAQRKNAEALRSARRMALQSRDTEPADRLKLVGEVARLETEEADLAIQLELLQGKLARLKIESPVTGQVVTWNLEELLSNRPVQVGQRLLTIAKPEGGWELELMMPERRMGHLMTAWREREANEDLPVSFILATDPGMTHHGDLIDIQPVAELDQENGHAVRLRVRIDPDDATAPIKNPRPGAAVIADVKVGRRPIGYVWLHEGYEWIQRNVFF